MEINSNKNGQKFMDFKTPNNLKRSPLRSKTLRRDSVPEPDYSFNKEEDTFKRAYFDDQKKQDIISRYRYNLFNDDLPEINNQPPIETKPDYNLNNTFQDQSLEPSYLDNQFDQIDPELENISLEDQPEYQNDFSNKTIDNNYSTEPSNANIFENAISNAPIDFPKYKELKKKFFLFRHPVVSTTVLLLALIIGAGSIIIPKYNLTNIPYVIASYRAGFWPLTSSYRPTGYSLSSISSATGIVDSSYQNNNNGEQYSIIEKKSTLSSSQLLNNYVIPAVSLNYVVLNTSVGKIYVYNNGNNATWVRNGILYLIKDNGSLNNTQIINIASSM